MHEHKMGISSTRSRLDDVSMTKIYLTIATVFVFWFLTWLFHRRMFYRQVPSQKLPHNLLMGHALVVGKELRDYPPDLHADMGFVSMVNTHSLWDQNIVYIDLSPFVNISLCFPTTPAAVSAVHNAHLRKSTFLSNYIGRLVGLRGLVLVEGKEWKDMRSVFNPGFAAKEVIARISDMVDEGEVFVDVLAARAKGDGFVESMSILLKRLTFDIIMRATLGIESSNQRTPHPLGEMIRIMSGLPGDATSLNPLHKVNFVKFGKWRYYEWKIKQWLKPVFLARWEEIKNGKGQGKKYILDLALESYRAERVAAGLPLGILSANDIDQLADVIKGFVFGGHDTTASTAAWTTYELSRNPNALKTLRDEHTEVFGSDLSSVSATMRSTPHILNKLPYTTAVIKECMRLYPVAGSLQAGPPNTNILVDGTPYPISNQIIHITHQVLGRNPNFYPSPNAFLPERFLPSPPPDFPPISNDLYRPFERLPRNCIGQEMAMLELKVILVLTARRFEFSDGYAELDRRLGRKEPKGVDWAGGRAYMVGEAGNIPKDGIPMRVREVRREIL